MARFPTPLRVAAVPFALSAILSLSTVGNTAFWQDSGAYLVAVKELGILYPHGFVLYLLLCKAWTVLFGFLDFTLAVHLFSSACAAAAAAVLALATRAWLRTSGPVFRILAEPPGDRADWIGAGMGCLAACGYTFWFAGIYAKGYSLLFLILSLILWWMIRADESRRPRDFTVLAALIGLVWAAHPAASLLGAAFLLYVVAQRRIVGVRGMAWRTGLAAACAAGPTLLLPLLASLDPWFQMGNPRSMEDFLEYFLGRRFTQTPGAFGYASSRFASFSLYFWEEFLGVGCLLVALGLIRLILARPYLSAGLAAWIVPYSLVTLLFKLEGQHDLWLVAAWLPLFLVAGLGLDTLAVRAGRNARAAIAATVLVGVAWGTILNRPLLNQRGYTLADDFARAHMDNLDEGSILLMEGDDVVFLCAYAQRIAGRRPDLVLVWSSLLYHGDRPDAWYDRKLLTAYPFLKPSDYTDTARRFPHLNRLDQRKVAFLRANAASGRPIFFAGVLPEEVLPEGYSAVPAGWLSKIEPGAGSRINLRYWDQPLRPEDVRRAYRRERGQKVLRHEDRMAVEPEAYERRLVLFLLGTRASMADVLLNRGEWANAAAAYESILRLDEAYRKDAETLFALAAAYRGIGRDPEAERILQLTLRCPCTPVRRAETHVALGQLCRKRGDAAQAARHFREALEVEGLDARDRSRIEGKVRPP